MGSKRKNAKIIRPDEGTVAAKDADIKSIALLMSQGKWRMYPSTIEYAATTGLSTQTVKEYASQAARLLRLYWVDDATKTIVLEKINQLGEDAVNRREEVLDKEGNVVSVSRPDFKSAVTAMTSVASILGMTKVTHELKATYERMSDEQLFAETLRIIEQRTKALPAAILETTSHDGQIDDTDDDDQVDDAEFANDDSGG